LGYNSKIVARSRDKINSIAGTRTGPTGDQAQPRVVRVHYNSDLFRATVEVRIWRTTSHIYGIDHSGRVALLPNKPGPPSLKVACAKVKALIIAKFEVFNFS
jgi:hypothetical protein